MAVRYRILGPLEVTVDGRPAKLGGHKERSVLAILLINANHVVSTDRLIDQIWGERPPPGAASALQSYVSNLRKALHAHGDEVLITKRPGYVLEVESGTTDADRFEAEVAAGQADLEGGNVEEAAARLRRALAMWTGPPLAGFEHDDFAAPAITRLEELRLVALETRIAADIESGLHPGVIAELEALVEQHPSRERLWGHLMIALYRDGRQADALRAYQTARAHLGEELGIEPTEELRRLEERILLQDPTLQAVSTDSRPPGNLPVETTSFVGRTEDVARIRDLFRSSRLVTLLGVGGVGKSRLALRIAYEAAGNFADGVWKVDLLGLADPAHVATTTAATLAPGSDLQNDAAAALSDLLVDKDMLIVLDNCESVTDGAARLSDLLLRSAPGIKILATSREPLELQGETLWRVAPLASPDPVSGPVSTRDLLRYDSVDLFCQRAAAADPGFRLDEESALHIARVCRLLEGIPLAIELAAARVRHMTVAEIDEGLDDRFTILVGGGRMLPRRHRALHAAIDWSYEHLAPVEREFLERLGVFQLEFPLDAAEVVCSGDGIEAAQVRDLLGRLTDKSLVMREARAGHTRYRLLNTMQNFLFEKIARGHGRYHESAFLIQIAQSTDPALRGPEEHMWAVLLGGDPDVARATLRRASDRFREDQGAFLAGAAAALTTQTGRVGLLLGLAPTQAVGKEGDESKHRYPRSIMGRFLSGYRAGVAHTNPDVTVDRVWLTDEVDMLKAFRSPALGREAATDLYSRGCDVVLNAAGLSGGRIFEAARRMSEDTDTRRWGIGVDVDGYLVQEASLRPYILASIVKQIPIDVYKELKDAVTSDNVQDAPHFDLSNKGIRFATTGGGLDRHLGTLASLQKQIVAGAVDPGGEVG